MKVKIVQGKHGSKVVKNTTFKLAKPGIHPSKKGPFVLVDGTGKLDYPQRNFRIVIGGPQDAIFDEPDQGLIKNKTVTALASENEVESDGNIKARIRERFDILKQMSAGAAKGEVKGLIVSGAPGVGKSFEVEEALHRDSLLDQLSFNPDAPDQNRRRISRLKTFNPRYQFISGHMSAAGFYRKLYEFSARGEVIIADDCDSLLYDETSLNLIKAALDTTRERILNWATSDIRGDDVPKRFTYEGSLIFITNLDFEKSVRSKGKLAPHLEAMMDRCFYLDMTIDTLREKLLRIEQVSLDFGMLDKLGFDAKQSKEIMGFVRDRATDFRHLSLRKVVQLGDLYKQGGNWQRKAEVTLMKTR